MKGSIVTLGLLLAAAAAQATESPAPCVGVTEAKSKSREFLEGKILMTNLLMLESQGEARFHPTFASPATQCTFATFDVQGQALEAIYSPFETGEHTLHWRFAAGGTDPRNIYVVYDGMASLMAKKSIFFVMEERGGSISYYAMYRDQPTFEALKPLVTRIVDGSAEPLAAVRWPTGAKEPVIDAYSKRLK